MRQQTRCTRAACSGSRSASQRSLVTVNDIVGTDPVRAAHSAGAAELGDKLGRLRRRLHVVPQHGGPDHRAGVVERDHAVLLRRDPHRVRPLEQAAPGRRQRLPPAVRMALGPVRVRRGRLGDDRPVLGLDEEHLGGLRGGIDPCDQRHDGDGNKRPAAASH